MKKQKTAATDSSEHFQSFTLSAEGLGDRIHRNWMGASTNSFTTLEEPLFEQGKRSHLFLALGLTRAAMK